MRLPLRLRAAGVPRRGSRGSRRWWRRLGVGGQAVAFVALASGLHYAALLSLRPSAAPAAPGTIPKVLHTSWITPPEGMPERMRSNFARWAASNPDVEVDYYDDEAQREWMGRRCPQYFPAWRALRLPAGRADLFRYCLLYERGGFWADVDMTPLLRLSDHVNLDARLVVTHDLGMGRPGYLYNAFMGAQAGHPALKRAMEIIWGHYLKRHRTRAVDCTGPGVLWRAVNDTLPGGAMPWEFVGYQAETATQYLLFRGNGILINASGVPFMNAKYGGYLEDATFEGREPHYGREVTWDP